MDEATLRTLLEDVRRGAVTADDAVSALRRLPFADLGDARIDHHRALRQGVPEAIYGPGKSPDQCVRIVAELLDNGTGPVLLTRTSIEQRTAVVAAHPGAAEQSRTLLWRAPQLRTTARRVVVCSGGTADAPVVGEAHITLRAYGFDPLVLHDVGVAGLHRLLAHLDDLETAAAIIVVAGMEAALASVIGGLTAAPIIAVPTSTGYGSSLDGITALLGMTASCASGMSVVGIDNGFGAASAVARILRER